MPVYEFVCQDCRDRFDTRVPSLEAAHDVTCASCASDNVRRQISTFAMVGGLDDPVTPMRSSGGCCGGSCGCGN
jgi:putative FmdB family regulatory protein